ncbi:MAG: ABC transporter permease, partial [Rhodanobacter sp.]
GVGWILAAMGVYLRDISQIVGVFSQLLMFLSPVFFPASRIPDRYQGLFRANPLTGIIEQARAVLVFGAQPNWSDLLVQALVALTLCVVGYGWFTITKRGFADVL